MGQSIIYDHKILICLIYLLFCNNYLFSQNNTASNSIEDILTQYPNAIVEGKFETEFKLKTSSINDTLTIKGLCQFNKNYLNEDSVASFVFFENKIPTLLLFDNWLYEVWLNDSTYSKIKFLGLMNSRKGFRSKAIFWDYLKSNKSFEKTQMPTSKLSNNFNVISCLSETSFFEVGIADTSIINLCYDSIDFAIYRFNESVSSKKLYDFKQFSEWNLSKISMPLNTIGFENYIYWIESNFKKKVTIVKSPIVVQVDSIGEIIKAHSFITFDGDTFVTQKMNERYLLIDFWYSTCFPCLKAIPSLNKLSSEYAGKLKVIGINSRKADFVTMQNLISKFSIQYDMVLDSTGFWRDSFKVEVFPTLYLYDTILNKVMFTEIGYKEDLFDYIQKIIE